MVSSVKKICFTASTGGHFEQLMMLKPLMLKNDSFIVTEKTKYSVINNNNNNNIYYLEQINRQEKRFIFKMIINAIKSLMIFVKENKIIAMIQVIYLISALLDINWFFFGLEQFKITVMRNTII